MVTLGLPAQASTFFRLSLRDEPFIVRLPGGRVHLGASDIFIADLLRWGGGGGVAGVNK